MNAGSRHLRLAEGLTTRTFASLTGGLTRRMIEDICLRSVESGHPVDSPLITERKDEIVKAEFGDLIEIVEPRHGFDDVGGLVEVKRYLMRSVVGPLRDPTRRGRMPSGMLFAGPPGTGKTYVIVALAYEAGVPMVKLNAGRLLGHYHGTSERNLEKALKCIRALRPCLVLVDEIDQQFQRGDSGDSGVERRLFGRLLEEMSGSGEGQRGDTVWFAATNRVDKVDPALLRRFGKIVPILPPGRGERGEILCAKLRVPAAQWATTIAGAQLDGLLDRTDGFTGAEIDNLIVKAIELADDDGRETSTIADVTKALGLLRMPSSADREHMLRVALEMCNDLELIPAEWRDEVRQIDEQRAAA